MIPGEILCDEGEIEINVGRPTQSMRVANTGDRPVQVGSHYHFFEVNPALDFDRAAARGYRLAIAAGTAVRFEPGQSRTVELIALAGDRVVYGFAGAVMGPLDAKPGRGTGKAAGRTAAAAKTATGKTATGKTATGKTATGKTATGKTATGGTKTARAAGRRRRGARP